jgi:hypothetical protein
MLKRFFYASVAVLMLAIAFHIGASTAHSQAGGTIVDADDPGGGSWVVTSSGTVYFSIYGSQNPSAPHWTPLGTIPATAPIVRIQDAGTDASGNSNVHAFDASGNFYVSTNNGGTWARRGNVFGVPVPALQRSWGQVKALYHPTPGMTVTPGANDR